MNRCTTAALAAVALAWLAGPAPAQTKLRYQFKEGATEDQVLDQKMKVAMTVNGMNIDIKIDQSMEMSRRVEKVDADGTAHVRVKFGRVKLTFDGFTGSVEVDSADDAEPADAVGKALHKVVRAIAACDLTAAMAPTGEVKDVTMTDAARKKLQEIPTGGQDGGFGNFTSEGGIKAMVQGGLVFPAEAVRAGATWTRDRDFTMPFGKLDVKTKYTYEGTEEKDGRTLDKIALVPTIKLEPDPNAPMKLSFKAVESKGRALFDNRTGRLVETVTDVTMEATVEVNGMTITQNIVQETTVRPKAAE